MLRRLGWLLRLLSLALLIVGAWYWFHGPTIPEHSYLLLDVSGTYSEARPAGLVQRLVDRGRSMSDLLAALRKVRHDGRIDGVIARIDTLNGGWGQAQEIRNALALVKAGGKRVIAELEVELAPANREIYVASVADAVYVAPAAAPLLTGLQAKTMFLGGVWPKLDVTMQVEKIRDYKSAGDELSRESMSPAHREMLDSILDDLSANLVRTIAEARNLAPAEVEKAIARGVSRPQQLVEAGLANAVRGHAEVLADLGGGKPAETVTEEVYAGVTPTSLGISDGPTIAVVHASGPITMGKSATGGATLGSRSVVEALTQARDETAVSAIVLRVSSPGGSPAASDEIWLAIREAAKKKPVIASLGDVAASGGYYLASAADRIVSAPGTLTGSIGVVFFKPDFRALMDRVGVHTETLQRGRFSRLLDVDKPLVEDELALVRMQLADIYRLFLERVATGRKKKPEDIDRVGGGRVWTGQQAFDRGLVDELGTFEDAVRAAANAAGIHDTDKVQLVHYPQSGGLAESINQAAGQASLLMQPPALRALAALAEQASPLWTLEPGVQAVAETLTTIE